ncbi:MAG TPA: class I SAM-dependent methyltransferase [Tepiditoga sp.]|nr:class I SAM-dependent methyltransferase [Thermotogota bacterium]HOO75580.1 class I SAM-dependent methyltransferase [Tepiditoga sp.]
MFFDSNAQNWDEKTYRIKRAEILSKEILNSLTTDKNFEVLDFGCGTGLISFNLRTKFRQITLADSSEGMIRKTEEKIKEVHAENMNAVKTSDSLEELKDKKFDIIYTSMALHHITDTQEILKNLYSHLKKNGQLCIIELCKENGDFHKSFPDFNGHNGFEPHEMKALAENAGFKNISTKVIFKSYKNVKTKEIPYELFLLTAVK